MFDKNILNKNFDNNIPKKISKRNMFEKCLTKLFDKKYFDEIYVWRNMFDKKCSTENVAEKCQKKTFLQKNIATKNVKHFR